VIKNVNNGGGAEPFTRLFADDLVKVIFEPRDIILRGPPERSHTGEFLESSQGRQRLADAGVYLAFSLLEIGLVAQTKTVI
jgi:hypothetical protein